MNIEKVLILSVLAISGLGTGYFGHKVYLDWTKEPVLEEPTIVTKETGPPFVISSSDIKRVIVIQDSQIMEAGIETIEAPFFKEGTKRRVK